MAANTVTLVNVETIVGGTGSDIVILSTAYTGGTIDLSDGNDRLVLANAAANTVTIANIETLPRRVPAPIW